MVILWAGAVTADQPVTADFPYFQSGPDALSWRQEVPEIFYPASLIPGLRELGTWPLQTWGGVYPRTGWTTQPEEPKAAALNAQRAGDIVTRTGQPHVYVPVTGSSGSMKVWPPGPLVEKDRTTGTWQMLLPRPESTCNVFGTNDLASLTGWGGGRVDPEGEEPVASLQMLPVPRAVVPVFHRLDELSPMNRFTIRPLRCRRSITWALIGMLGWNTSQAVTKGPMEDSLWYYEIGGAEPVSVPANPSVVSITLGGSAQLGMGYSCGKFDPVAAVTNTLNDISAGVDNMLNAMTAAASAAIAALPALILQRANPGLYDMFQNALLQAEETMQLATKSCEQMEAEIAKGKNPYADLIQALSGPSVQWPFPAVG